MKHSISVEEIKLYAQHGCLEEEEKIGSPRGAKSNLNCTYM